MTPKAQFVQQIRLLGNAFLGTSQQQQQQQKQQHHHHQYQS
jgi:hypothetical protein